MDYIGLLFEVIFLAGGVYLYLFALGKAPMRRADAHARKRAEAFRKRNARWLRVVALLLVAVSLVNLAIHLAQLWG